MPSSTPIQPDAAAMVRLSDELTTALRKVVDSSSIAGLGPIEAARVLGVDKTLVSRLLSALRASDPLQTLTLLPGTSPLRRFIRAAAEHGARAGAVRAAEAELGAFELQMRKTFGTRTHLDAAIADSHPEAQRRQFDAARQGIFRGMALIKGVAIDVASISWLIFPSREAPDRVDAIMVAAFAGVRRLRPTARVTFMGCYAKAAPEATATLVTEFCRPRDLSITTSSDERSISYELATGPVRKNATADVVLTEVQRSRLPRSAPTDGYFAGEIVSHPYKRLTINVIVHADVWRGCDFSLQAFDAAATGLVKLPNPSLEHCRLPVDSDVNRWRDVQPLRSSPIPRHLELLDHVAGEHRWPLDGCRVFNCDVAYPVYGAQFMLVYEP